MAEALLPRRALVVYGSETGNAQDVAEEMGRLAVRLRFDTHVAELDAITLVRRTWDEIEWNLILCRNNSCNMMLFSLQFRPRVKAIYHQIARLSGELCAVLDSDQDVCSR